MTDDALMRFRLQQVASYRALCQAVRRGGRHNVVFAALMLLLAYATFRPNGPPAEQLLTLVYVGLGLAELAVGLFKSVYPSAEGVLLDGFVLLLFAAWTLGRQGLVMLAGGQPVMWIAFLGLFMLYGALGRFKEYRHLRTLFAERPTPDQMAWFDDLVYEIRTADPQADDQALDLPTRPRWKAKLLGGTAFVVAAKGDMVVLAGPDDFTLTPDGKSRRTGAPRVALRVYDQVYPAFEIDDASWSNYLKWVAANPAATHQAHP